MRSGKLQAEHIPRANPSNHCPAGPRRRVRFYYTQNTTFRGTEAGEEGKRSEEGRKTESRIDIIKKELNREKGDEQRKPRKHFGLCSTFIHSGGA
jgi:hypothetical protein